MPPRKEAEEFAAVGVKDCWHPYGLQDLSPDKFVKVVTRILAGKFELLDLKWDKGIRMARAEQYGGPIIS
ncbi:MAG: hypothetical protein CVT49_11380 [candidate division Zixibacteria bacterium HGW-Zixibacteria-1]|nr:MAG: hypothetical protein CVT49_11380 [candidate division Zixibacteria bacterium HGW-Zixibacteria-1]